MGSLHNFQMTDTDILFVMAWILVLLWILVDIIRVVVALQEKDDDI